MGKGAGDSCRTPMMLTEPVRIDEQFVRDLYSAQVDGVYGEIHGITGALDSAAGSYFVVVGRLVDSVTGQTAGAFSRQLNLRDSGWEAHHAKLTVVEQRRGQGLARRLLAFQEDAYRAAGIRTLTLNAEWHGAALWLSQGFEPDDPEDARHSAWLSARKVLDPRTGQWVGGRGELLVAQLEADRLITSEQAQQARELFAPDGAQAHAPLSDAVNLGRDTPWRCADGRTLWLGRAVMAGADYQMTKRL